MIFRFLPFDGFMNLWAAVAHAEPARCTEIRLLKDVTLHAPSLGGSRTVWCELTAGAHINLQSWPIDRQWCIRTSCLRRQPQSMFVLGDGAKLCLANIAFEHADVCAVPSAESQGTGCLVTVRACSTASVALAESSVRLHGYKQMVRRLNDFDSWLGHAGRHAIVREAVPIAGAAVRA